MQSAFFYPISVIVFSIHSFLNFYLCNVLSEKTRFHKFSIYLVCLLNGFTSFILLETTFENPVTFYFLLSAVLITEFVVLFEGKFLGKLGVALGSLLHLFVIRAVIMATVSLVQNISFFEVYSQSVLLSQVNLASFATQLITLTMFIILIPLKTVKKIMSNRDFYMNLFFLTLILCSYMIYNSHFFKIDYVSQNLAIQEIVLSLLVLTFFYIMILSLIRIFNLGEYKEKTKELEVKIRKDKILTDAIFDYATIIIEINCTKDAIERLLIESKEMPVSHLPTLREFFAEQSKRLTHPEDVEKIHDINSETLIFDFNNGILENEYEYRSKKVILNQKDKSYIVDDNYYWYKMRIVTHMNTETSDIIALLTVDEIHDEKEEEIALRDRAEKDSLTGAYNKSAFEAKMNTSLRDGSTGVLFMFDLDNFKGINDNMGHSAGDAVLREVNSKVSALFRGRDLIGRIGGDEFVVFLEGSADEELVGEKAREICKVVNKTYHAENKMSIEISSSVGVSVAPKDGNDFETLFKVADLAMYKSKNRGKNTYTIYDSSLDIGFEAQSKSDYSR